jgi:hypothetical protein
LAAHVGVVPPQHCPAVVHAAPVPHKHTVSLASEPHELAVTVGLLLQSLRVLQPQSLVGLAMHLLPCVLLAVAVQSLQLDPQWVALLSAPQVAPLQQALDAHTVLSVHDDGQVLFAPPAQT